MIHTNTNEHFDRPARFMLSIKRQPWISGPSSFLRHCRGEAHNEKRKGSLGPFLDQLTSRRSGFQHPAGKHFSCTALERLDRRKARALLQRYSLEIASHFMSSNERSEEAGAEENHEVDRARAYAVHDPQSERIFFNRGECLASYPVRNQKHTLQTVEGLAFDPQDVQGEQHKIPLHKLCHTLTGVLKLLCKILVKARCRFSKRQGILGCLC